MFADYITYAHFGLVLVLTGGPLLVVYALSNSLQPPAGLGLFTVYFMLALLAWIAFAVGEAGAIAVSMDVPAIAAIVSSYALLLAVTERAGIRAGRYAIGGLCMAACIATLILAARPSFLLYLLTVGLCWALVGLCSGWQGWKSRNAGDGILASAGLVMFATLLGAAYALAEGAALASVQGIVFGLHSTAHAMVIIGFLTSLLLAHQQQLSGLTTLDPLTRLLNQRGLEGALHVTLANASRHGHSIAAIMLDVSDLKQLDDQYGRATGDKLLQQIARCLEQECRTSDVVSRYGNTTFFMVLPNTDLPAARTLAERIRERLAEQPLVVEQQAMALNVSLGVASRAGDSELENLHRDADRALKLARRSGHNRVAAVEHRPLQLSNGNTAIPRSANTAPDDGA
ncbi:MAG TPA: GGDEF domain-containing protein [Kineobactrum sp.]